MASAEFKEMREHGAADIALRGLIVASRMSMDGALIAAFTFLDEHSANCPDVPLMQEQVRREAMFWTDCATAPELEAYAVASITALGNTPLTAKQVKRLAAMAWRRMSAQDRAAFKDWIKEDE